MPKLVPIVEGDGETTAVPLLLRKILVQAARYDIQIAQAKSANGRGNLTKIGGLERFIKYAWKERDCGAILVLMDADADCTVTIARDFSRRVEAMGVLFPVVIVLTKRMYEAWFVASISTIAGHLDLPPNLQPPADAETVPNPKTWIEQYFPPGQNAQPELETAIGSRNRTSQVDLVALVHELRVVRKLRATAGEE